MRDNNVIVSKLQKELTSLEKTIKYRKLYNVRNYVAKKLLKTGIALNYALPYILGAIIAFYLAATDDNVPFRIDEITEKAKIETINTSSGYTVRNISYDYNYNDEILEHTTGWIVNEYGLYERIVTTYRINDEIDLSNTYKVFAMSKEEIDNALVITNINKITKSSLDSEDMFYDKEALIIIDNFTSDEEFIIRDETIGECIFDSLYYIIVSFGWGSILKFIKKKTIKTRVEDKLNHYESNLRYIRKKELETLKRILELKQNNLDLISGKLDSSKEEVKVLRKNK